ncbi:hypothetical protein NVP2275O_267 [Vibrio phage 2.275.O._10N.286.54.E11]|nr:hypothetical protein NVP2275O_267 [Vibrio phage 2.275.O._10N.286.54.E11]
MAKSVAGVNKYPFGTTGIRIAAASMTSDSGTVVSITGEKCILKQASSSQYKIIADSAGTYTIDTVTFTATTTAPDAGGGTIAFNIDNISFTVAYDEDTTSDELATEAARVANLAGIAAVASNDVCTFTHTVIGPQPQITYTINDNDDLAPPVLDVTSVPGLAEVFTEVVRPKSIGKQELLFDIMSYGIAPADTDSEVATKLFETPGSFAIRVWKRDINGDPVQAGYIYELGQKIVSIAVPSTGIETDLTDTYVTGSYELVSMSAGVPVIPAGSKSKYFIESRLAS